MFNFLRKSPSRSPSAAIIATLGRDLAGSGLPPGMDPATLVVLEERGSYSGRNVTYFRIYDPVRAAERSIQVRDYADLNKHPELVLVAGHREKNGAVTLIKHEAAHAAAAPERSQATRADHADDEQFVFPQAAS